MKNFKFFSILIVLLFSIFSVNGIVFNQNGDFTIELISPQETKISNQDITTSYSFKIKNNLNQNQIINISPQNLFGFDILQNPGMLNLEPNQELDITLIYRANSEFDYQTDIQSSDVIKISLQGSYQGKFDFPILIQSQEDSVSFTLRTEILPVEEIEDLFLVRIASNQLSPIQPLRYTISAEQIELERELEISVFLNDVEVDSFVKAFSPQSRYEIFEFEISPQLDPAEYNFKVSAKLKREDSSYIEWVDIQNLNIVNYNPEFQIKEDVSIGLFSNKISLEITNNGNTKDTFTREVEVSTLKQFFFSANVDYIIEDSTAKLELNIDKGETKTLEYKFNYVSFVIILLTLIVIVIYLVLRKLSNPLAIETKLYDIKKSKHEGVKSLKVQVGFENIKAEEIEDLKVIFRMPTYLTVKDNSFLLTAPKQVLKGATQYKMVWEFKRFEKEDARILGFTMVNSKGILGDVRLEDLEMEVKINGKVKKYYKSFPIIKG